MQKYRLFWYTSLLTALCSWGIGCSIDTFPTPKPSACRSDLDCLSGQFCKSSICAGLAGEPNNRAKPPSPRPPAPQAIDCAIAAPSRTWSGFGGEVRGLAFGQGSSFVAAAGVAPRGDRPTPGEIRVLDIGSNDVKHTITGFQGSVHNLAYHPSGQLFASASLSGDVIVWDAATNKQKHVLKGHQGEIVGLAFSPDGTKLASGGYKSDSSIRIWSTNTWKQTQHLKDPFVGYSLSLAFAPDSNQLFSGGYTAMLWDTNTGKFLRSPAGGKSPILAVAWHPAGKLIAYGLRDGQLVLADPATGKVTKKWAGHTDRVSAMAFSGNGNTLITGGLDSQIHFWNTQTQKKSFTISDHKGGIHSIAMHPKGHVFAAGSGDKSVRTWKCGVKP